MHIIITVIFGQVNQDSCSTSTVSGPAEAAVADAPAGRAPPLLMGETRHVSYDRHANARHQTTAISLPNSAERLGPPLRNGCGDRGRRTDPELQRTRGYDSWSWCRLFSGGTGGKWFPEYIYIYIQKRLFRENDTCLFRIERRGLTFELLYTFSRTLLQMFRSSASVMSSTGRTTWGIALAPLKERRRGWN